MNDKSLESYQYYHRSYCMFGPAIVYLTFILLLGFIIYISFTKTTASIEGSGRFGEGTYEEKNYIDQNKIYGLVDKKNEAIIRIGQNADFTVANRQGKSIRIEAKVVKISKKSQFINKNYFYSLILKPRKKRTN